MSEHLDYLDNGPWTVIGPDGSRFTAETPYKAAREANKHRAKQLYDPVMSQQFSEMIERAFANHEAENARLTEQHGSLNCPTCGGSGHFGDAEVNLCAAYAEGRAEPMRVLRELIESDAAPGVPVAERLKRFYTALNDARALIAAEQAEKPQT